MTQLAMNNTVNIFVTNSAIKPSTIYHHIVSPVGQILAGRLP